MANIKRIPKKGIIAEGTVLMRPGKNSNRLHVDLVLSKEDEIRLYKMLHKRHGKRKLI